MFFAYTKSIVCIKSGFIFNFYLKQITKNVFPVSNHFKTVGSTNTVYLELGVLGIEIILS